MLKTYINICSRSIRFQALHTGVPCWRSCNDNDRMRSSRPPSQSSSIHSSHNHPDHILCVHAIKSPNLFIQNRQTIMLALGITSTCLFCSYCISGEVRTAVHMELLWHLANLNNIFNWHTIFSHYHISSDMCLLSDTILHGYCPHPLCTTSPPAIITNHMVSWVFTSIPE